MKVWWARYTPELAGLPPSQRAKVVRECYPRDHLRSFLFVFLGVASIDLGRKVADSLQFGTLGSVITTAITGAIAGLVLVSIQSARMRPRIRSYLMQHKEELKTT